MLQLNLIGLSSYVHINQEEYVTSIWPICLHVYFLSNIRYGWFSHMMTTIRVVVVKGPVFHDDVIKSKYFPRYWPFVRGIRRSSVNSLHKGQWRGALMFSLFCARTNAWVTNRDAGDLRGHLAHFGVTVRLRILVLMVMVDDSILPVCYFFFYIFL